MATKPDRKYLKALQKRYFKTRKLGKKVILDEFTKTTGYDRKHSIKLLRGTYKYVTGVIKRPKIKGRSYTKPGTLLKTQIPIRTWDEWNENKVGFEEIDLVGHGRMTRLSGNGLGMADMIPNPRLISLTNCTNYSDYIPIIN